MESITPPAGAAITIEGPSAGPMLWFAKENDIVYLDDRKNYERGNCSNDKINGCFVSDVESVT